MGLRFLMIRFCILSSLFYSCQNDLKKEEKVYKEVMELHNQVMPRMEKIYDLRTALTKLEDSLDDDTEIENIRKRKRQLIEADEAMMDWMRNYKDPDESESHEFKMSYYLDEKRKMESVRNLVEQSIDSADSEIIKIRNLK